MPKNTIVSHRGIQTPFVRTLPKNTQQRPPRKRLRLTITAPTLFSLDERGQVQETGGESFTVANDRAA